MVSLPALCVHTKRARNSTTYNANEYINAIYVCVCSVSAGVLAHHRL